MSSFKLFLENHSYSQLQLCVTDVNVPAHANAEVPEVMEIVILSQTKHVSNCSKATLYKLKFSVWHHLSFNINIMYAGR